jgi:hypothetical protein
LILTVIPVVITDEGTEKELPLSTRKRIRLCDLCFESRAARSDGSSVTLEELVNLGDELAGQTPVGLESEPSH